MIYKIIYITHKNIINSHNLPNICIHMKKLLFSSWKLRYSLWNNYLTCMYSSCFHHWNCYVIYGTMILWFILGTLLLLSSYTDEKCWLFWRRQETTSAIVGLSTAWSCTHKRPTWMHLSSSFSGHGPSNAASISLEALPSFHSCHA